MTIFNQNKFNKFVLENNVVGFFDQPITLKSGRQSNWYVNWRTVVEDVFLSDKLSNYIIQFTESLGLAPDTFYGVPEGATKMGILTQYKWAKKSPNYDKGSHVLAMGRAKPKDHGAPKDKFFVGMPKGKTIILDDVTTTGMSLIETIKGLKEAGVEIIAAFGLTNRMEKRDDGASVKEAIKTLGVDYYELSKATEILPKVCKIKQPSDAIKESIMKEFKEVGIEKVKLR